jgi:hypothetical protein
MASDIGTAEVVLSTTLMLIGTANWKLSYPDWLEKIEAEDDEYWQSKWFEWKDLVKAMNSFDAHTLAKIVS